MQVALIMNSPWLQEELTTLRPLVVGMLAEGVRVIQVLPQSFEASSSSDFGQKVYWDDSAWSMLRKRRLKQLAGRLEALDVDMVHGLHADVWDGTLALSQALEVPALLTAAAASDVITAAQLWTRTDPSRVGFAAHTETIAQSLEDRLGSNALVHVVHPGVHITDMIRPQRIEDQPLCAVISGDGRVDDHYMAVLEALRSLVNEEPASQFFFDSQGTDQHKLWQIARRLGLLGNISLVPRPLNHRELLLGADALVLPQALGRARGLLLQAMAHDVPVIAREDPWLDFLVEGKTAWTVHEDDPKRWLQLLRSVADPKVKTLTDSAKQYVQAHHLASDANVVLLDLYRRLTGETIPFASAAG